jgi:formate transporter
MPLDRLFVLAILAGAFIALGAVFSTAVTAGAGMPVGASRLLGGVVFSLGVREAILIGVLANALVCLAIWLSLSARSVTDKILAIVFPISAFVAAGFEHSIATMYFIPAGLVMKAWSPRSTWDSLSASADDYPTVTWQDLFVGTFSL